MALQINSDVQNYRNSPDVRKIRAKLQEKLQNHKDAGSREKALNEDSESIFQFMARMNNLCWMIGRSPENTEVRDSILSTISNNLAAEWNSVKPLAEKRRQERCKSEFDNNAWYMKDFGAMATCASERFNLNVQQEVTTKDFE